MEDLIDKIKTFIEEEGTTTKSVAKNYTGTKTSSAGKKKKKDISEEKIDNEDLEAEVYDILMAVDEEVSKYAKSVYEEFIEEISDTYGIKLNKIKKIAKKIMREPELKTLRPYL